MELGATVCRPQNPACDSCPVSSVCKANTQWQEYLKGGGLPDIEDAPAVTMYPSKKEVKAKKEQSVAVCVLEIVLSAPKKDDKGDVVELDGSKPAAAKDMKREPLKKKQRTMLDYSLAAKAAAASGGDSSTGDGTASAALLSSSDRHYLMTKRPDGGLLAGLWEFPGVIYEGELTYGQRQAMTNEYLHKLLGVNLVPQPKKGVTPSKGKGRGGKPASTPAASNSSSAQVLSRRDVGSYVHVFSHIRLTLLMDELPTLQAPHSPVKAPQPKNNKKMKKEDLADSIEEEVGACRWVCGKGMADEALSTGPKKIFQLATGEGSEEKKGKKA
eukprot:gene5521-4154_t